MSHGRVQVSVDAEVAEVVRPSRLRGLAALDANAPWLSMGELPLTHGFCPFALGVGFARERPFSADDREHLTAVAGISVLALARASRS